MSSTKSNLIYFILLCWLFSSTRMHAFNWDLNQTKTKQKKKKIQANQTELHDKCSFENDNDNTTNLTRTYQTAYNMYAIHRHPTSTSNSLAFYMKSAAFWHACSFRLSLTVKQFDEEPSARTWANMIWRIIWKKRWRCASTILKSTENNQSSHFRPH